VSVVSSHPVVMNGGCFVRMITLNDGIVSATSVSGSNVIVITTRHQCGDGRQDVLNETQNFHGSL